MPYDPRIHRRRSIRFKGYDYSRAGLYFITICAQNRACLFGKIPVGAPLAGAPTTPVGATPVVAPAPVARNEMGADGIDVGAPDAIGHPQHGGPTMILNDAGKMIETEWQNLEKRFPNIKLHEFIIMPNHFHGILEITPAPVRAPLAGAPDGIGDDGIASAPVRAPLAGAHNPMDALGAPTRGAPTAVGDIIAAFKSITTVEYIRGVKNLGWQPFQGKLWQRNYWEHIIRNEPEYHRIANYIINNPQNWAKDKLKS